MTNIEKVLSAICAGHEFLDAVVAATGLTRRDVRNAFDHLRASMRIEAYANVPRMARRGHPQRRYRVLTEEARLSKQLYRLAAQATRYGEFTRSQRGDSTDTANRFLDHGNYLAYGLGATATWVLGLPHGLAVLHGKTRRGGLVFDVADLVKDAVILPQAFISAMRGDTEQEFRQACIETLTRSESLDFMIDTLKAVALRLGAQARVPDPSSTAS